MHVTYEVYTPNFPNYLEVAEIDRISDSLMKRVSGRWFTGTPFSDRFGGI
jgi:hypothetical protein